MRCALKGREKPENTNNLDVLTAPAESEAPGDAYGKPSLPGSESNSRTDAWQTIRAGAEPKSLRHS